MEISSLKKLEGKKVTVILKNNNVYSNIVFKTTNQGTIEFVDSKKGDTCYVLSEFVVMVREEKDGI